MTRKAQAEPVPMQTVAVLDGRDQLIGYEKVPADAELNDKQVPCPDDCDLKPGLYWWDRALQRFEPLKRPLQGEQNLTALAIVDGFRALSEHTGCPLPATTQQLIAIIEKDRAHRREE